MMTVVWLLLGALFVSFLLIVLRGAPFVPTRRQDVDELFTLHTFQEGDVFVDLGSGDGRMLVSAARRGITAVGFELNPFLVWYTKWRLKNLTPKPEVRWQDFWASKLPDRTAVVFVFLAGPFMARLDARLTKEASRLGRDIILISYGVGVPGRTPIKRRGAYLVYSYKA